MEIEEKVIEKLKEEFGDVIINKEVLTRIKEIILELELKRLEQRIQELEEKYGDFIEEWERERVLDDEADRLRERW